MKRHALNRSLILLAAVGAIAFVGVPEKAEAGLFCGKKCKAEKELKKQQKAAADAQRMGYPAPQPQYQQPQYAQPAYPQPQANTYAAQQEAYRVQQEAYYAQQRAIQQQQAYEAQVRAQQQQTYNQQYGQPQYQQPQYQQPAAQTYSGYNYSGRIDYGQLNAYANYMQFASMPYGYVATPAMGAAYDKTPYGAGVNEPEIANIIVGALAKSGDIEIGDATVNKALVAKFYAVRANQPAFVTAQGPTQAAVEARTLFTQTATLKGLDPRDYWSPEMQSRFDEGAGASAGHKAALDLLMVQSYIRIAGDLMNGRAVFALIDTHHKTLKKRTFNDFQALSNTLRPGISVLQAIESFEPQHAQYKALLQILPKLLAIKAQGGWAKIPGLKTLKPGGQSTDVPLIRQRLVELNILPSYGTVDQSPLYDQALAQAVMTFQTNHKLKPDGILGGQGFGVLNIPVEDRIDQVRATLEKWRWLPRNLGDRYFIVNIARQEIKVVEFGRTVLEFATVNGKLLRPTNILIEEIGSVDLNPYWNPPSNNILSDIMPAQRQDPMHMAKEHVKIFGQGGSVKTVGGGSQVFAKGQDVDPGLIDWKQYINSIPNLQFREEPGPANSLGVVKFDTRTGNESIYLHDTNHRELFNENERLFSSGCIRLQKPFDLLQYVLRDQPQYDNSTLDTILSQPQSYPHKVVQLTKPIPLYVTYQTISFDDNNQLRFSRDYYGMDARIIRAITPQDDSL